ncbi:MAG: dienelactone hydrolase family protein [Gammaproteobacteria bacterium]|nr:dienelactone hydrolase family protein [Gammaproteobacteria bacterium]
MINYTKTTYLNRVELNPENPALGSIIWMHGLGADGHDFVPLIPELNLPSALPLRFIFPHAPLQPVTINNGYVMRAWFDIKGVSFDAQIDEEGIAKSVSSVHQWIQEEKQRGIPTDRIILAGFSQGAAIALQAGLRFAETLGGVIALSGALPAADKLFREKSIANSSLPIFIAHGTEDSIIPIRLGEMSAMLLKNQGYPTTWKQYDMGHSVCPLEIQDISQWLANQIPSPRV